MKVKKELIRMAAIGLSVACLQGCIAPNPTELAVMERDRAVYVDKGAMKQKQEEKAKVAILVSAVDYARNAKIAQALDSQLASVLSEFAFFEVIERSNLGTLNQEVVLASLAEDGDSKVEIPQADFLITAKVSAQDVAVTQSQNYFTADVSVDFRFYQIVDKKMLLAKNIQRKFTYTDVGSRDAASVNVATECAKAFGFELGSKYAPPARVLELRGNGQVARISMGTNYGVVKGVKIDFFEYADNSDMIAGATREPSIVARGIVLESDTKSAWVEIDNYEKVFVKRGHYVRIRSDQSKGLKDAFRVNL